MKIDFHVHPLLKQISEKEILSEMEKAGIEKAVLLALDLNPKALENNRKRQEIMQKCVNCNIWSSEKVLESMKRILTMANTSNKLVAKIIKNFGKHFIGIGSVDPSRDVNYVKEKLKEIEKLRLEGVKLIPTLQLFNPKDEREKLNRILEFCEKEDKILIFHTGCDPAVWENPCFSENANPKLLEEFIRSFKKINFVLAHMGAYSSRYPGIWLDEALKLGKKYHNVWFDISAVTYLVDEKEFVDKIRCEVGWNHVLFGSDFPVIRRETMASAVKRVENSSLISEKEKIGILGLNAARLLKLI